MAVLDRDTAYVPRRCLHYRFLIAPVGPGRANLVKPTLEGGCFPLCILRGSRGLPHSARPLHHHPWYSYCILSSGPQPSQRARDRFWHPLLAQCSPCIHTPALGSSFTRPSSRRELQVWCCHPALRYAVGHHRSQGRPPLCPYLILHWREYSAHPMCPSQRDLTL